MLANGIDANEPDARLCVIRILPIAACRKVWSAIAPLSPKTAALFCDLRHKGGEYGKGFFHRFYRV